MKLRAVMFGSDLLAAGAQPDRWDFGLLCIFDSCLRRWRSWSPVAWGIVYKENKS